MRLTLDLLRAAMLVLTCAVLLGLLAWMRSTARRTDAILTHVDQVTGEAAHTMKQVALASRRQQEVSDRMLGTIDSFESLIHHTDSSIGRVSAQLVTTAATLQSNTGESSAHLNAAVDKLGNAGEKLGTAADTISSQAAHFGPMLDSGTDFLANANRIITGPSFTEFLQSGARASTSLAMTAHDTQTWWHDKLYPPKATGKAGFLINSFRTIHGAAQLGFYVAGIAK